MKLALYLVIGLSFSGCAHAASLSKSTGAISVERASLKAQISLLDKCPGDTYLDPKNTTKEFGAIFSAVLAYAVPKGIAWAGQKLKESSEEKTIETLHKGDHFYQLQVHEDGNNKVLGTKYDLSYTCLIVVTSPKTDKVRENTYYDTYYGTHRDWGSNNIEGKNENGPLALKNFISDDLGYDSFNPSSILILDIERSKQGKFFRLAPRYFAYPHSPREKSIDNHKRDFSYEIRMTTPGGTAPFLQALIPFKKVKSQKPYSRKYGSTDYITSQWFPFPSKDSDIEKKIDDRKKAPKQKADAEKEISNFKAYISNTSIQPKIETYGSYNSVKNISDKCPKPGEPNLVDIERQLISDMKILSTKLAVPKSGYEGDKVILDEIQNYITACKRYAVSRVVAEFTKGDESKYASVPFDINITIKEFRKKPIEAFVAGLLSDETFRGAASTEFLNQVDPARRKTAAETAAAELMAARIALDTAVTQANIAIEAQQINVDPNQNSRLLLMSEQAQRAANRAAQALQDEGVALPFPEAGIFVGD